MKKVLMLATALLVLSVITPVMAPATKTPVAGYVIASATVPGEAWFTEGGIMFIEGAEAEGAAFGDMPGDFTFTMSAVLDLKTGNGFGSGTWVVTDDYGTFEGIWRTKFTDYVYSDGTAEGYGTDAYEGMLFITSFEGYNLYMGGYTGDNGVYFDFEATILSPHGVPLP